VFRRSDLRKLIREKVGRSGFVQFAGCRCGDNLPKVQLLADLLQVTVKVNRGWRYTTTLFNDTQLAEDGKTQMTFRMVEPTDQDVTSLMLKLYPLKVRANWALYPYSPEAIEASLPAHAWLNRRLNPKR
jgi:hypothetical protein